MNIFYVDSDPVKAAQALCDKHIVKMIIESAQLLSNAHHTNISMTDKNQLYKLTHKNHPCSLWVLSSIKHYEWLFQHMTALSGEYTKRYGKIHASSRLFPLLAISPLLADNPFCPPPQCMPNEFKDKDTVKAYRNLYNYGKRKSIKCTWKNTNPPNWWLNEVTS